MPLYLAFMHTGRGIKVLEINSRPGDPEIINLLALIQDDFVDVCFKMIEGNLTSIKMEKAASVLTYKVPLDYGGYSEVFPDKADKAAANTPVDLSKAQALTKKYGGRIRVYPGSMETRDGKNYALKSRAVGVLGIGESIEEARKISLEGAKAISGGALVEPNRRCLKAAYCKSHQSHGEFEAQGVKRIFISDCEGPISKNDNAFELAANFIPNGDKLFTNISKYDDVLADVLNKPGYTAGSTLKLILPFFKAYGVTDKHDG